MNWFEKIVYLLQSEMSEPKAFGWFHLLWIGLSLFTIFILYTRRKKHNEKQLKIVLGIYGIISLILEVLKQIAWSFNYDSIIGTITWDYEWYSFPFQLCTTPTFVCLISLFLKKGKLRDSLLSYLAYITILGSIATIFMPDSCFVNDILANIDTMWIHLGSFVVSVYILISNEVTVNIKNFKNSVIVFIVFVFLAQLLNITIYNSGVLNGETFNMFYISPYFISSLPVFDVIQQNVPYLIFLVIYIFAISLGGFIIFAISKLLKSGKDI